MSHPHIPGGAENSMRLPCDQSVTIDTFDMGMRDFTCTCGETHAVVMDVHPIARWVPESVERVLKEVIEPSDDYESFETIHLMGLVLEEFPNEVCAYDASEDPSVGWAVLWVSAFDSRRLHEVVIELLVELMDHAVGHASDAGIRDQFLADLKEFDVGAFVDEYRVSRDFSGPKDEPA